jgi:transcriptional regulator with XRE-family HTH domain
MSTRKNDPKFERSFERGILRSAFRSLFWGIICERKKRTGYKLVDLAKAISTSKHEVSRWFNGDPNWTINTIANIAHALNVDLRIEAVDRSTQQVFTPAGLVVTATHAADVSGGSGVAIGKNNVQSTDELPPAVRLVRGAKVPQPTSTEEALAFEKAA